MVLPSCELMREELIDVQVSETLSSHEAVMDPREETEGIAVKGTESAGRILLLKRDLTLGLLILNRVILVVQRYCLDNNNNLSIRLH